MNILRMVKRWRAKQVHEEFSKMVVSFILGLFAYSAFGLLLVLVIFGFRAGASRRTLGPFISFLVAIGALIGLFVWVKRLLTDSPHDDHFNTDFWGFKDTNTPIWLKFIAFQYYGFDTAFSSFIRILYLYKLPVDERHATVLKQLISAQRKLTMPELGIETPREAAAVVLPLVEFNCVVLISFSADVSINFTTNFEQYLFKHIKA